MTTLDDILSNPSFPIKEKRTRGRTSKIIATYKTPNSYKDINFTKEHLLLMYHILRFQYVTYDIADTLYQMLTEGKGLNRNWFYSCVGTKSLPLSKTDKPYRSPQAKYPIKVYYPNTSFVAWLLVTLFEHKDLAKLTEVTEYKNSLYSIKSNRLIGGKPYSVNHHDMNTRVIIAKTAQAIVSKSSQTYFDMNIQFAFPWSHLDISLVPDAALFVGGYCYFFEYDRGTEDQARLLSKLYGYGELNYYTGSTVYFGMEFANQQRAKFSKRLSNFMYNATHIPFDDNINTDELLKQNKVKVFLSPALTVSKHFSNYIIKDRGYSLHEPLTADYLNENKGLMYHAQQVKKSSSIDFDYIVTVDTFDYDTEEIPLIHVDYLPIDLENYLTTLYDKYHDKYNHIILRYSKSVTSQFYVPKENLYFLSIYI